MIEGISEIHKEIFNDQRKKILIRSGLYFHNVMSTDKAKRFVGFPQYFNSYNCEVFGRDMLDDKVNIEKFIPETIQVSQEGFNSIIQCSLIF